MPDDATVEILLKWKQENERVVAEVQAQLAALTVQTQAANAATEASSVAVKAGALWWGGWASAIALAAAALAPFLVALGSAAVIIATFAVAAAGTLALLGGLALGFGAIGAAVVALGLNAMGGTDPGAALEKAQKQLASAKQALADFDRIHSGIITTTTTGPSVAAGRRLYDAQQALIDFHAAHPGALTPAQVREQEDLNLRLARAEADYHATTKTSGALTPAQQVEREHLIRKLTAAQDAYNAALVNANGPMNTLRENLEGMFDTWGKQAAPMTSLILVWANQGIPAITQFGSEIMKWFGDRLPGVLITISSILRDLTPTFVQFGQFVGATMDKVFSQTSIGPGGTIKTLASSFEDGVRLMVGAAQGLIGIFTQLSGWFLERLPVYGPIVQQILDVMGKSVLTVASIWGKLADWLVTQWPTITDLVQRTVRSITEAWDKWSPQLDKFLKDYGPLLLQMLQKVADNSGSLIPLLLAFAQAFVLISTMVLGAVAAIEALIDKVYRLGDAIRKTPLSFAVGGDLPNGVNSAALRARGFVFGI